MKFDSMKLLISKDDIIDYVYHLLNTSADAKAMWGESKFIESLIIRFADTPKIFFDPSHKNIEWTHFSSWWGAIVHCSYENPYIQSLRYIHEIYHAATFPYVAGLDLPSMRQRNMENERMASAFTEMGIYFEIPDLRRKSFDHPIFVDKLLDDDYYKNSWKQDNVRTIHELVAYRMNQNNLLDDSDPQIIWIKRYKEQNERWVQIWKNNHQKVDNAMLALRRGSFGSEQDRYDAAHRHVDWLKDMATYNIPFYNEAVAFRKEYDRLLSEYTEAMAALNHETVK